MCTFNRTICKSCRTTLDMTDDPCKLMLLVHCCENGQAFRGPRTISVTCYSCIRERMSNIWVAVGGMGKEHAELEDKTVLRLTDAGLRVGVSEGGSPEASPKTRMDEWLNGIGSPESGSESEDGVGSSYGSPG